jgi:hypothetical protein
MEHMRSVSGCMIQSLVRYIVHGPSRCKPGNRSEVGGPRPSSTVSCTRAMQAHVDILPHGGTGCHLPCRRRGPSSSHIKHHATSMLVCNAPSGNIAHINTSIRTWRWRHCGLEKSLELIPPAMPCNVIPVGFFPCLVSLDFITLLSLLQLDKSLFLTFPLAFFRSYFLCVPPSGRVVALCC